MITKEKALEIAGPDASAEVLAYITKIEEASAFQSNGGRKDALTKTLTVQLLRGVADGAPNDRRYYLERLVEKGYLERKKLEKEGRGRKPIAYLLTGKGRGFLAISKNWKI